MVTVAELRVGAPTAAVQRAEVLLVVALMGVVTVVEASVKAVEVTATEATERVAVGMAAAAKE